eukprot:g27975.t1
MATLRLQSSRFHPYHRGWNGRAKARPRNQDILRSFLLDRVPLLFGNTGGNLSNLASDFPALLGHILYNGRKGGALLIDQGANAGFLVFGPGRVGAEVLAQLADGGRYSITLREATTKAQKHRLLNQPHLEISDEPQPQSEQLLPPHEFSWAEITPPVSDFVYALRKFRAEGNVWEFFKPDQAVEVDIPERFRLVLERLAMFACVAIHMESDTQDAEAQQRIWEAQRASVKIVLMDSIFAGCCNRSACIVISSVNAVSGARAVGVMESCARFLATLKASNVNTWLDLEKNHLAIQFLCVLVWLCLCIFMSVTESTEPNE